MRLITSTELYLKHPESQSVVFVGNAPSMKGSSLGAWIDAFDVVVRFNECVVSGHQDDVGKKTDILVVNPYIVPRDQEETIRSVQDCETIIIMSLETRRPYSRELGELLENKDVLFTFTPDILMIKDSAHSKGLTTGTYGVYLLSRILAPSRVGVTGFTMFLKDTASHYWQSETPSGLHAHDVEREAEIFIEICNKIKCKLEVTEDIVWISEQVNKALSGAVKLKESDCEHTLSGFMRGDKGEYEVESLVTPDDFCAHIRLNNIDYMDFGCSKGGSLLLGKEWFGGQRGLGLDISREKIELTKQAGFDAICYNIHDIPRQKLVRFTILSHFLEHIPDANDCSAIVEKACEISKEFVYIQQPYFDADSDLLRQNLKLFWSDWTGHPNRMTSLEFMLLLTRLKDQGLDITFSIHSQGPLMNSDCEQVHPLHAPPDQHEYDGNIHPRKNSGIEFEYPVYREIRVLITMPGVSHEEILSTIKYDNTIVDSTGLVNVRMPLKPEGVKPEGVKPEGVKPKRLRHYKKVKKKIKKILKKMSG